MEYFSGGPLPDLPVTREGRQKSEWNLVKTRTRAQLSKTPMRASNVSEKRNASEND